MLLTRNPNHKKHSMSTFWEWEWKFNFFGMGIEVCKKGSKETVIDTPEKSEKLFSCVENIGGEHRGDGVQSVLTRECAEKV